MRKPLTDKAGEVRSLTEADMRAFAPIGDIDPGMLHAIKTFRRRGRPTVPAPKLHIGLRLDADIVQRLRASGRGYNARVNKLLREALAQGKL